MQIPESTLTNSAIDIQTPPNRLSVPPSPFLWRKHPADELKVKYFILDVFYIHDPQSILFSQRKSETILDSVAATQLVDNHHAFETHSEITTFPMTKRPKRSIPERPI